MPGSISKRELMSNPTAPDCAASMMLVGLMPPARNHGLRMGWRKMSCQSNDVSEPPKACDLVSKRK